MSYRLYPLAFTLCWASVTGALAQEPSRIGGVVSLSFAISQSYGSDAPRPDAFEAFPGMIANVDWFATERLTFRSEIRAETVRPPTGDRYFEDVGIFLRSAYAEYDFGRTKLTFGKFTPSFAVASLVTPGIFGNNYNKDYELIERIGFGLAHRFEAGAAGTYTFSGSTFFKDTSFLSDSLGSSRGQASLSDGGAGNTERFDNFAFSLNATGIEALPGYTFQLGLLQQSAGRGDFGDEQGLAFAVTKDITLREDRSLLLIGEIAAFDNFGGTADSIQYYNAGISYITGPWNFVLSGTYRRRDLAVGGDLDDYSAQIHATYDFGNGWLVGVANEISVFNEAKSNQSAIRVARNIPLGRSR
jgi:hypothetical protein